jgi:hypothetical protein
MPHSHKTFREGNQRHLQTDLLSPSLLETTPVNHKVSNKPTIVQQMLLLLSNNK